MKSGLQEFKKQLENIYGDNLNLIILFGSTARGNSNVDSDIDILIILNEIENYFEERKKITQIEIDIQEKYKDTFISAVLTTYDKFQNKLEPLYLNVKKEGIAL